MDKPPDFYKILSLPHDADEEQIKKAYKEKALQYHPDVNPNKKAVEVFQLINLAYQTLIDRELRRQYDLKLKYNIDQRPRDVRYRHPADAAYFSRKQHYKNPVGNNTGKSLRRLNHFIFYSITAILVVGIIYGVIDLFENYKFGGLLFSIVSLAVIFLGVKIIRKEKSGK